MFESQSQLSEYPELLRQLLSRRGIKTTQAAQDFFSIDYAKGHDPYLLKDMRKGVERITQAIRQCFEGVLRPEQILIFSDYDHDGVPGAVVLYDFFKKIGLGGKSENGKNDIGGVRVYIPHRHDEGFGLNREAVEGFARDGVKLMITIDCGITDVEEVALAQKLGMDVIITDHHIAPDVLPPAYAIINPKQSDCEYPEKMLCGSGVIFKVVQALVTHKPLRNLLAARDIEIVDGWEKWLLDMVGIATFSDMVPLLGENRIFAHYGLKVLRKSPRAGLAALLRKLKIDQRYLSEDDIGFMISPRINAASRMGVPMDAFKLLSTEDVSQAGALAEHLDHINNERKGKVASLVKEIRKILAERFEKLSAEVSVIVAGNPNWSPALLGLVAGKLVEEYDRPVFLWGRDGDEMTGTIKGSCRSNGKISLVDVMNATDKKVFKDFGGHAGAGGFSVEPEQIHYFQTELEKALASLSTKNDLKNLVEGQTDQGQAEDTPQEDAEISLEDVTWQTYTLVEKMAPFGMANPKPIFRIRDVILDAVKLFGKEKNHLELITKNIAGKKLSAIGFFMTEDNFENKALRAGAKVDLFVTMEKSMFRGFPELRLRIVDVKSV